MRTKFTVAWIQVYCRNGIRNDNDDFRSRRRPAAVIVVEIHAYPGVVRHGIPFDLDVVVVDSSALYPIAMNVAVIPNKIR